MMTSKSKEEKIQYLLDELILKGNPDVIEEAFSPEYIAHARGKMFKGHAFLKRFSNQLRTSIPKIKIVDVTFLLHNKNTVTWQRTLSGIHKVEMQGIPASNKKITWVEMVVTHFENGKIAEEWIASELMGELLLKSPGK